MIVAGLMSGTSADAVDAVVAEISGSPERPRMRQLAFRSTPWRPREKGLIERLIGGEGGPRAVSEAGFRLGAAFGGAVLRVVDAAGIAPAEVDLVGSHGQTVWHGALADGSVGGTLQLGEAAVIAERTGITTVADFRVADVAAGGQGAPLIPIFDRLFLRPAGSVGVCRAALNIGGIGNVTLLPAGAGEAAAPAFDTGPGNALIDWAAARATQGAQAYDVDGRLAASGRSSGELVERWLSHPYFGRRPPKSTGRELFSGALAQGYRAQALAIGLSESDFVATVTRLTAASIAESCRRFAPMPVGEVIVSGGGARNPVLLQMLREEMRRRCRREVPVLRYRDAAGLPGDEDSKEALCFGLLAWLAMQGAAGNVAACTGARGPRVLGKITPGRNFCGLLARLNRGSEGRLA